ncbi:hypothetical protein [Streptomyces sp. NPDC054804]
MNLVLAVINAREGNRGGTHERIDRARAIAARWGEDRNDFDTEFGPTNVDIHADGQRGQFVRQLEVLTAGEDVGGREEAMRFLGSGQEAAVHTPAQRGSADTSG